MFSFRIVDHDFKVSEVSKFSLKGTLISTGVLFGTVEANKYTCKAICRNNLRVRYSKLILSYVKVWCYLKELLVESDTSVVACT